MTPEISLYLKQQYEADRAKYKHIKDVAKERCQQYRGSNRKDCIHHVLSTYYSHLSDVELHHIRELAKAGSSLRKINIHKRRAQFYKDLSRSFNDSDKTIFK